MTQAVPQTAAAPAGAPGKAPMLSVQGLKTWLTLRRGVVRVICANSKHKQRQG